MMRKFIKDGVLRGAEKVGFDVGSGIKTAQDGTALFKAVEHLFRYPSRVASMNIDVNDHRRHHALAWKTVHDLWKKNKCKFVGE